MKLNQFLSLTFAALLCAACDRVAEAPVLKVYVNGNEYEILDRGDRKDQGLPAHFIRYYSEAPLDEAVRAAELEDIYALVAKHVDTNEHQRIVVTAVERSGPIFGLLAPREHTESVPVDYVLQFKEKKSGAE